LIERRSVGWSARSSAIGHGTTISVKTLERLLARELEVSQIEVDV